MITSSKIHRYIRPKALLGAVILISSLSFVTGCINKSSLTSVENRFNENKKAPAFHRVKQGDTLFSIALSYGIDYRKLASANSISKPYHIYEGQRIDIRSTSINRVPPRKTSAKKAPKRKVTNRNKKITNVNQPKTVQKHSISDTQAAISNWKWPSNGRLIRPFSTQEPINKGIDITGNLGDSVSAASAGTVVFAGQGLRGYGNLVIIEHNRRYLSAYAHVSRILVKEQEKVKAGQIIAEIGSTGTNEVKLHFEIRDNGKAVNPVKYLPTR